MSSLAHCSRFFKNKLPIILPIILIGVPFLFFVRLLISGQPNIEKSSDYVIVGNFEDLSSTVDDYCRNLDERYYAEPNPESESTLTRAKRAKLIRDSLIFFPASSQMWCLVPKAASTSWSKIILQRLENDTAQKGSLPLNDTKPLQVILKEKYGLINKMKYIDAVRNEDVKKILLVRHPFARIASAFRDKLKNRKSSFDGQYFYQHYGALIIRKYRKDRRVKQLEPTFSEFIDFLLDRDPIEYDEHWQPISLLCGLCHVKYHHVIKTESLGRDPLAERGLLTSLEFGPKIKLPWENKSGRDQSAQLITGVVHNWISNYYKNVSRSKMVLLYKKFEMDFHAFNYSFLQYYYP